MLRPPVEPMLAQACDDLPPPAALPGELRFQPGAATSRNQDGGASLFSQLQAAWTSAM